MKLSIWTTLFLNAAMGTLIIRLQLVQRLGAAMHFPEGEMQHFIIPLFKQRAIM